MRLNYGNERIKQDEQTQDIIFASRKTADLIRLIDLIDKLLVAKKSPFEDVNHSNSAF